MPILSNEKSTGGAQNTTYNENYSAYNSIPIHIDAGPSIQNQQRKPHEESSWPSYTPDPTAIIGIIAIVAYFLQAQIMRKTLVTTNRPYVSMEHIDVPNPVTKINHLGQIDHWVFSPVWQNAGATPTVDLTMWANYTYFPDVYGIPDEFDFPDGSSNERGSKVTISPRSTKNGERLSISISELNKAWRKNGRIYIWGWAEYSSDLFRFRSKKRSEFCVEVIVVGNPEIIECSFKYRRWYKYNGSDSECLRKAGFCARRVVAGDPFWPPPAQ